jgi:hypothetical protein
MNGADGIDFSELDGADGVDRQTAGGKGGKAGIGGTAEAAGQANGIVALNPNGQGVLQWSFNHGQTGTLVLDGGGGGGGGGGGEGTAALPAPFGGNGGNGRDASGSTITTQTSNVNVTAVMVPAAGIPPTTVTNGFITVDMGWTSSGSPTLGNVNGAIWQRNANLTITLTPVGVPQAQGGGAAVVFIGGTGPGGPLLATCVDGFGNFYQVFSTAPEDAVVGTLGVGAAETLVWTQPGATATIVGGNQFAMQSILTGDMTAFGGQGGEGGTGGARGRPGVPGDHGLDGGVTPSGLIGGGAPGGAYGAGGDGDPMNPANGGRGGRGGNGGGIDAYASGFYQGTVSVWVEQLDPP